MGSPRKKVLAQRPSKHSQQVVLKTYIYLQSFKKAGLMKFQLTKVHIFYISNPENLTEITKANTIQNCLPLGHHHAVLLIGICSCCAPLCP